MIETTTQKNREPAPNRLLTIPNGICAARLVGSLGLIALAAMDRPNATLALFLVLAASDWIDGKIAVWLDQRSEIGPRLDSMADGVMYTSLLVAMVLLKGKVLANEWVWISLALLTYVASNAIAFWRFRRPPTYHTRLAKTAWFATVAAAISLALEWSVWPVRAAMVMVTLANVEGTLISLWLTRWRTDVVSFIEVRRQERSEAEASQDD